VRATAQPTTAETGQGERRQPTIMEALNEAAAGNGLDERRDSRKVL
jgi:hypothetical protein